MLSSRRPVNIELLNEHIEHCIIDGSAVGATANQDGTLSTTPNIACSKSSLAFTLTVTPGFTDDPVVILQPVGAATAVLTSSATASGVTTLVITLDNTNSDCHVMMIGSRKIQL